MAATENTSPASPLPTERGTSKLLQSVIGNDVLSAEEQQSYLLLLSRGASPAAACMQLSLSLLAVANTVERNAEFAQRLARVNELLSQNVAAALYRSAMEGSVSAQTFYLKNRPPPEWPDPEEEVQPAAHEGLTDDELIAKFCQEAPALLARFAAGDSQATGTPATGPVPGSASSAQ